MPCNANTHPLPSIQADIYFSGESDVETWGALSFHESIVFIRRRKRAKALRQREEEKRNRDLVWQLALAARYKNEEVDAQTVSLIMRIRLTNAKFGERDFWK
ncbi:hypothetical protein ABW19_dt0201939 [Dactylella cylindrospora]|nr:hypothetical protein ABW19_dt0201939 [Dactylella cylindrospora]